jgi:aminoglycoside/choline kinase family phosphotransferase
MHNDNRLKLIKEWLPSVIGTASFSINPASSDASFRRYFRVTVAQNSWIVMDAPPDQECTKPFVDIANFLFQHHIHVPEVKAINEKQGFLLLTDFGNKAYLDELNESTADVMYSSAIDGLINIQKCPTREINLPAYDRNLLNKEMMLFPDWYLNKHLNIPPPDFLQNTFDILIDSALEQPKVVVHRDYHSRNLMHTNENSPGIIDFQDAVIGPITYDLVSLLRDCYISWPQEKIDHWLFYYYSTAQDLELLIESITIEQFTKWFDLMGLQRHIKVLGIFCRLNYRDNKPNYINDLPLTLHYVQKITAKYPEFTDLNNFLKKTSLTAQS